MFKVSLLVLSGVSLLPLAVQAMNEGEGWHTEYTAKGPKRVLDRRADVNQGRPLPTPPVAKQDDSREKEASSATNEKGKEKEKEKEKKEKPKFEKTGRDMHMSGVMMLIRNEENQKQGSPLAKWLEPGQAKKPVKPLGLKGKLEQAQENRGEEERFISRISEYRFYPDEVKDILEHGFASLIDDKKGKPILIRELYVNPKMIIRVLESIRGSVTDEYVKKVLRLDTEKQEITAEAMQPYYFPRKQLEKISNRIVAIYDTPIDEKYEGVTVTTKRAEEDEGYKGKLLKFKLMIQKKSGDLLALQYPFENYDGQQVMKPSELLLSVTFRENN